MSSDSWDGYTVERDELMTYLRDNDIRNVVALTGDVHAHFAGVVLDNHDSGTGKAALVELVAAGISSNTTFSFFEYPTRAPDLAALRPLTTYDNTTKANPGTSKLAENLNTLLLWGTRAAKAAAESPDASADIAAALAAADPNHNPWLKYSDTNAKGYGLLKITPSEAVGRLITIEGPIIDRGDAGAAVLRTATFTIAETAAGEEASLSGPAFADGDVRPFPLG